jgi:hypothetical protein
LQRREEAETGNGGGTEDAREETKLEGRGKRWQKGRERGDGDSGRGGHGRGQAAQLECVMAA